ncbi:hypothetical protein EDB82DRAFT_519055 [Fusarium venenatum]|uniref:uncharacterized protein n=1 Tax=Fusarium venenatum TaxID=56646 RepID=UPI001D70A295|nr:hypothetical protein EDB82DRAFT_519055 [Fusarium venenatum]
MGLSGKVSASSLKRMHLFALKVVVIPVDPYLPIYATANLATLENPPNGPMARFTSDRDASTKANVLEHQLVRMYGALGLVWSALNDVTKPSEGSIRRSDRNANAQRPDYNINRTFSSISLGSESSIESQHSGTSYTEGTSPKDMHLEECSVHLLTCAMRLILHNAQPENAAMAIEFRARERLTLDMGTFEFVAIDDGGLRCRTTLGKVSENFVAGIEAKRDVKTFNNSPIIYDDALAQMAYEVILVRANSVADANVNSVVIIHIAGHHVCFLEFRINAAYLTQLRRGRTPTEFLRVSVTRMFNLERNYGRTPFAENMARLIAFSLV